MKIRLTSQPSNIHPPRVVRAFTLPEVMISVVIVSVMFVSLYSGISQGFAVLTSARENLRATQIMIEKIEVMRLCTWSQINSNGFLPTTFTDSFVPGSSTNSNGTTYYGKISISTPNFGVSYTNTMKEILITLNWTNGNIGRSRDMKTYVTQNGLQSYIY